VRRERRFDGRLDFHRRHFGLRREAEHHTAFGPRGKFADVRKPFVRAKAVSRLPPCHRSPKRSPLNFHACKNFQLNPSVRQAH